MKSTSERGQRGAFKDGLSNELNAIDMGLFVGNFKLKSLDIRIGNEGHDILFDRDASPGNALRDILRRGFRRGRIHGHNDLARNIS